MSDQKSASQWTGTQAYVLAIICLVAGIALGYLVRGSASPAVAHNHNHANEASMPADSGAVGMQQPPTPEQLKHMADVQAKPLLEQLKANPKDVQLLYKAGNVYYDAQQFPQAISYYEQAKELNRVESEAADTA